MPVPMPMLCTAIICIGGALQRLAVTTCRENANGGGGKVCRTKKISITLMARVIFACLRTDELDILALSTCRRGVGLGGGGVRSEL